MKQALLVCIVTAGALLFWSPLSAQERSYSYQSIAVDAVVREDSTVRVSETLEYSFVGAYHQGWRSVPHKGIDGITDVAVVDGETGKPLRYSSSRLSKENPSSWGKYTVFYKDGATNIEWYYDLRDTNHRFIIAYTVHGAVGFHTDRDEFYWNVFTDYDVPVGRVEATVRLPVAVTTPTAHLYTSSGKSYTLERPDDQTFRFMLQDIASHEAVTIAVGWQKGVVSQAAYWRDMARTYWGVLWGAFVLLATGTYLAIWWRRYRRQHKGRGTIIPEYEPPQGMLPAMADVVMDGFASAKIWPATLVDLAIRGYVKITEDTPDTSWLRWVVVGLCALVFTSVLLPVVWTSLLFVLPRALVLPLLFTAFVLVILFTLVSPLNKSLHSFFRSSFRKQYIVTKTQKEHTELAPYEREFLDALFAGDDGETFSTRLLQKSDKKREALHTRLTAAERTLKKGVVDASGAFLVPPKNSLLVIVVVFFLLEIALTIALALFGGQVAVVMVCVGVAFVGVVLAHHMPRLNTKGYLLKEQWQGFALYLETAERYRMQNLTPEIFEKYLPYAMIFGVEKEWARAFEGLHLPPPQWYAPSVGTVSAGSSGTFSPTAFTTGFSVSFASSFAASGGSASSGGGSAGGGGGGGGGGAS